MVNLVAGVWSTLLFDFSKTTTMRLSFSRDSSSLRNSPAGFLWATINSFYSRSTLKELETLLNRFKPDIVQVQNIYPLISPHIFRLIKKHKVPVVMRCANYRLFCPTGLMLRDNKICENALHGLTYLAWYITVKTTSPVLSCMQSVMNMRAFLI